MNSTTIVPKTEQEYAEYKANRENVTIPATFISPRRGQRRTYDKTSLLRIDSVVTREQAKRYIDHGVEAYIAKTKVQASGFKERVVRGIITGVHGNSGVLRAKFEKSLTPSQMGSYVYVTLYKANKNYIQKD
ncbi:large subunit ribosomal protein L35Ae [Nematocida homosporus]|uniref:large subunit ribosomal protein L35Ae n=1 Tax=Nematocida homosporus TaxID=1912981 RepID=UPI0022212A5F|nr:large subunit ribosomal protein L35Ae [Nematocida homosporus]KAI5184416.1 large subunit ribosomal protein L35Ae [Nematocida homosporus]